MENKEYQIWSKSTARYPQSFIIDCDKPRLTFPFYLCLGLAGECGEAIEVLKKFARRRDTTLNTEEKEKLKYELGDMLWYFTHICTEVGLTLSEVMDANKQKLEQRYNGGP